MCIKSIESANDKWIEYTHKSLAMTRKEEEEKYGEVT